MKNLSKAALLVALLPGMALAADLPFAENGGKVPYLPLDEEGRFFLYRQDYKEGVETPAIVIGSEGEDKEKRDFIQFSLGVYFKRTEDDTNRGHSFRAGLFFDRLMGSSYYSDNQFGSVAPLEITSRCEGCPLATKSPLSVKVYSRWQLDEQTIEHGTVDVLIHEIDRSREGDKWLNTRTFEVPLKQVQRLASLRAHWDIGYIQAIQADTSVQPWNDGKSASFVNPTVVVDGKRYLVSVSDAQSYVGACKALGYDDLSPSYKTAKQDGWEQESVYLLPSVRLNDEGKVVQTEENAKEYVRVLGCVKN